MRKKYKYNVIGFGENGEVKEVYLRTNSLDAARAECSSRNLDVRCGYLDGVKKVYVTTTDV